MNNLKRIFSLGLATVMVIGMMVTGASAAFTDAESVEKAEAVNTVTALGIISGIPQADGTLSFNPKGDVTRAQFATMITMALTGGQDFRGSSVTGYPDVDGTASAWAGKFIKYCMDKGIISGKVPGKVFDPEGKVTAQEASAMILLAMGFKKAQLAAPAGSADWAVTINDRAEKAELYKDTDVVDYSEAINRENAAQMIYNGITAGTPVWKEVYDSEKGTTYQMTSSNGGKSMLVDNFSAEIKYAVLTGTSFDAKIGKYTYTLDTTGVTVAPLGGTTNVTGLKLVSETDYSDLFMQKVRIIYSGTVVNEKAIVFGITAAHDNVLGTGIWGTKDTKTAGKLNGATLSGAANTIEVYDFNSKTGSNTLATTPSAVAEKYTTFTMIDNDADSKVDCIVTYPVAIEKVQAVKDGVVTTNAAAYVVENETASKVNTVVEGTVAEGDTVTVAKPAGLPAVMTKVEPMTNVTVSSVNAEGTKVTINGTTFDKNSVTIAADGKGYDVIAINGYLISAAEHKTGSSTTTVDVSKIAYVNNYGVAAAAKDALGNTTSTWSQNVELIFTDGTKKIVEVFNLGVDGAGKPKAIADDNKLTFSSSTPSDLGFYTFTEKDGKYNLVAMTSMEGYDKTTATTKIEDGKQGTLRFNDDAILFVNYKATGASAPAVKVMSGADINAWETAATPAATTLFSKANANGFKYVDFGFIDLNTNNLPSAAASDAVYGYVIGNATTVYNATLKKALPQITIWNGETNETYFVNATNSVDSAAFEASDIKAGEIYSYVLTDGVITTLTAAGTTTTAVVALDGDTIVFKGDANEYDMSEAVKLFVDAKENTGVSVGVVTMADKYSNGDYINNVKVITATATSGKKVVSLIVADVQKNFDVELPAGQARVGAVATVAAFDSTHTSVTLPSVKPVTSGKVIDHDGTELFNVTSLLAGSTYAKEGAIIKLDIDGLGAGDKIEINNNGEQTMGPGDDVYYLIIGNQNATTKAAGDKGTITVTIKYTPAGGSLVTYTLKYAAWGESK